MLVNGQRLNRAYGVGGGLEMAYGGSGAQRVREMFDGRATYREGLLMLTSPA